MNLSFADLFNRKSENQESGQIDRSSEEDEPDAYERDEADEHYLSEYRDRNKSELAEQSPEDESEKDDRFSHKGHFYDQTHDRFNHSSKKSNG